MELTNRARDAVAKKITSREAIYLTSASLLILLWI